MLGLAYAVFDIDAPVSLIGVFAAFVVGILAFAGIGTLLGSIMPGARSAQGVGLLLFFGTFLLVGGGPPPSVFPPGLTAITSWTPTGLLIDAIRGPWSGNGLDIQAMVTLLLISAATFALAIRRLSRS
jgi:ABC-2 type transport system permease protein